MLNLNIIKSNDLNCKPKHQNKYNLIFVLFKWVKVMYIDFYCSQSLFSQLRWKKLFGKLSSSKFPWASQQDTAFTVFTSLANFNWNQVQEEGTKQARQKNKIKYPKNFVQKSKGGR